MKIKIKKIIKIIIKQENKMKITIKLINIINNLSKFYLNSLFIFISKLCGHNNFNQNAYFLPFIFHKLNPNVSGDTDPFVYYIFGMFILNLAVLVCFVHIIGYILSLYLVNKYDIVLYSKDILIFINQQVNSD
jgi:hypothetical protein